MTLKQLAGMLKETKIPFAYDHFAEGESPQPPFICYLLPGSVNFAADGEVYLRALCAAHSLHRLGEACVVYVHTVYKYNYIILFLLFSFRYYHINNMMSSGFIKIFLQLPVFLQMKSGAAF